MADMQLQSCVCMFSDAVTVMSQSCRCCFLTSACSSSSSSISSNNKNGSSNKNSCSSRNRSEHEALDDRGGSQQQHSRT